MKRTHMAAGTHFESLEQRIAFDSAAVSHSISALSVARSSVAAITVDSKAYFVGGETVSKTGFAPVDVYDARTGQLTIGQIPVPIVFKGLIVEGKPLVAAPATVGQEPPHSLVEIFDKATGQWFKSIGPATVGLSITSAGPDVLFYGPDSNGGTGAKTVLAYNTRSSRWSKLTSPAPLILDGPNATLGSRVFFLLYGQSTRALDQFDASTGKWSVIPVPAGIGIGIPNAVDGKLVFDGGTAGSSFSGIVIYNPATRRWKTTPLSVARDAIETAVIGSKVYFIGGSDFIDSTQKSTIMDIYDVGTGVLSTATCPTTVVGPHASVGNKLIFSSGDVYDASTGLWSQSPLSRQRNSMGITTVGTQAIFAGGTYGGYFNPVNNIDIYTDLSPSPVLSGGLTGNIGHRDQVTILNTGDADLAGHYGIRLYASLDRTLNGAILVGTRGVTPPLPAGASATFGVRTILPKDTPAGTYHLLAAISDDTGHLTPIAAEDATFRVGGKNTATSANARPTKSTSGALTRAAHSARQWT